MLLMSEPLFEVPQDGEGLHIIFLLLLLMRERRVLPEGGLAPCGIETWDIWRKGGKKGRKEVCGGREEGDSSVMLKVLLPFFH